MLTSDNKQIAKNTLFLYFRMIVVMLVTLYTTRVVLNILGEADFGIYNIIGGVVVLFSFFNIAMSGATQRYLSFALGKNDLSLFNKYYTASVNCYIILSIIIIIVAETVGLWFVNIYLTIPCDRMIVANVVYQLTTITFILNILKIPFEAAVISHERMSFYAYLSVIDVVSRLLIVFLLLFFPGDKLEIYAILMSIIPIGMLMGFYAFCHFILRCKYLGRTDMLLVKELFSFSGWSLIGGVANVAARQGGNILMNFFFGVTTNAAFGIANQVSSAVTSLVGSFQTAFKPKIIKLYAASEKNRLDILIFRTSAWSYYLMIIMVLPIVFNLKEILSFWLVSVPNYTQIFIILLLIYCVIDAIQAPIIANITATANIKIYEIWLSSILILNLPLSYFCFRIGCPPYYFFIIYTSLNFITAIFRTFYAGSFVQFPVKKYFCQVIPRILMVTIISVVLAIFVKYNLPNFKYSFIILILR